MKVRVLVVDDLTLFREGFRCLLERTGLEVVGDSPGAPSVYTLGAELKPDVFVVSRHLEGVGGLAVTRELTRRDPAARVLVLAIHARADVAREALSLGASGFALKRQPLAEIASAITTVAAGERYLAPQVAPLIGPDLLAARRGPVDTPTDVLSNREREVFDLLVRGYPSRDIGDLLHISAKTVDTHRTHLFRKLGVKSVVELVKFAVRNEIPVE